MKNTFILAVLSLFISFSAFSSNQETVFVDNAEIQQYNGFIGKWVFIQNSAKLNDVVKEFGADEESVKRLNPDLKLNAYNFIPFSKDYEKQLSDKGIFRREVISSTQDFLWPLFSISRISSLIGQRWGTFHPGVDLAVVPMTPIVAALDGKVILSRYVDGLGNCVIIEHRNGFITKSGHNTYTLVRAGDYVKKGQLIAFSGNTGRSTGPHLHFEIRLNDIPLDPLDFLPDDEMTADAVSKVQSQRK
ncbi:MAG: M23 family metallopeptidase [Spirochaetes bacterium]|nr:M23 family metallopeptidase [Spirochaetota bacterium]